MCLICVEFQRGKLTWREASDNLDEIKEAIGFDHYDEVVDMIIDSDQYQEEFRLHWLGLEKEDQCV